jgi:RNA polymerase sigma-70 factor (ECF subfamily)
MTTGKVPEAHSLESLFREHSKDVFRAAYRVTGSASDAEDALQTVFVRLARQGRIERLREQPGAYLKRAGTNAGLDLLRRRRTAAAVELTEEGPVLVADRRDEPDRILDNITLSGALREAIAALNERAAEVFVMRHIEGMSNGAIASELGTSAAVVAVTLHRARRKIEQHLKTLLGGKS